jgi:YjbE family integral membrane protein
LFHFAQSGLVSLLQVILIDITLAGDNAVVIGMAASRVPRQHRRKVIFWGLVAAVTTRVLLATGVRDLLSIIGLSLAGGILLLWVSWRIYREIRHETLHKASASGFAKPGEHQAPPLSEKDTQALVRRAIVQIAIADVSMSLDNVLAIAGAAINHPVILVIGLVLSIGLMGVAASYVARLLKRHPWISYAGLFVVLYVAITMIVHGGKEVLHAM